MKTPMQEFIEVLKIHRDTALKKQKLYEDLVLTEHYEGRAKAFEDAISFAEALLEKEKEVMCEFADDYQRNCFQKSADDYYNETFNTKRK
jgi:hypothetical protein